MQSVFFLDIDDCLIETSRLGIAELTTLENSLIAQKVPYAAKITEEFSLSFHRLYDHHQGKRLSNSDNEELKRYMDKLSKLQTNIIREYGQIKKWSRETFLYIAAEKYKISLSSRQIKTTTFALWSAITAHNPFYPDALKFLKNAIRKKLGIYLISSSDCRLQYDGKNNNFIYDPDYSKSLKLKRLEKFIRLGIPENHIFIGDPFDKPDLRLFKHALSFAKKDNPFPFQSTMVGDSVKNDLLPAKEAGINKLILIDRNKTQLGKNQNEEIEVIDSFDMLTF